MSPVWASRIGLIAAVGTIGVSRVELLTDAPVPAASVYAPVTTGPVQAPVVETAPMVSDWFVAPDASQH